MPGTTCVLGHVREKIRSSEKKKNSHLINSWVGGRSATKSSCTISLFVAEGFRENTFCLPVLNFSKRRIGRLLVTITNSQQDQWITWEPPSKLSRALGSYLKIYWPTCVSSRQSEGKPNLSLSQCLVSGESYTTKNDNSRGPSTTLDG